MMNPNTTDMIAIIIPCYNEAQRLDVQAFCEYMDRDKAIHFIFVDDGSTDDTYSILREIQDRYQKQVHVLKMLKNSGKAEAVRAGLNYPLGRDYEIIGFWDADLSTPLSAIRELGTIFKQNPKIQWVFGSRVKLLGRHIVRKKSRHYTGRIFATCVSIVLRLPLYDTQCGAKLFRNSKDLEILLSKKFESRWIFDVELIARLISYRKRNELENPKHILYEYPLNEWVHVGGSKIKMKDYIIAAYELYKILKLLNN